MIPGGQVPSGKFSLTRDMSLILMSVENISRNPRGRVCLFGKPDPAETTKLITEQFDHDRRKILTKYGYDILTEMPVIKQPSEDRIRKIDFAEDKENINYDAINSTKEDDKNPKPLKLKKMRKNPVEKNEKKKTNKIKGGKPYDKNDRQALVSAADVYCRDNIVVTIEGRGDEDSKITGLPESSPSPHRAAIKKTDGINMRHL